MSLKLRKEIKDDMDALLRENQKYLLAFSGGPDSVYILSMLSLYYKEKLNQHISLIYVNYHDSEFVDEEERIVYDYVHQYNLTIHRTDTRFRKRTGQNNFEEWARDFRYRYFASVCHRYGYDGVITGHQLSDLIETYILQKKRNNLPTYYGLRKESVLSKMRVIRPMMYLTKTEIIDELNENHVLFYDDITNKDPHKTRTKLRERVMGREEIDTVLTEIESRNNQLSLLYSRFDSLKVPYSFDEFSQFTTEEKKRFAFYLLSRNKIRTKALSGLGKNVFSFLNHRGDGTYPLDDKHVLYRTKKFFFVSLDPAKADYEYTFSKPMIYKTRYFTIDLRNISRFNLKKLPVTIRKHKDGDKIATDYPIKDVDTFLQKQQVPFYLKEIYPVFIVDGQIQCVPFYVDIRKKKIPLKFRYQ